MILLLSNIDRPIASKPEQSFSEGRQTHNQIIVPPVNTPAKTDSDQEPLHMLIIDDDDINNYALSRRIENLNQKINFSIAENGVDALIDLAKMSKESTRFPDLILLDLDMPYMNGFEFLSYYERDFYNAHKDTKVIVLTSSPLKIDQDRACEFSSVSQYVKKPFPLSIIS